jgi:hypothetical protein
MIMEVSRAHDAFENSRLEVTGLFDKACAVLGRSNVALLMVHVTSQTDREELRRLLRHRSPHRPTATVYLCHTSSPSAEIQALVAENGVELLCLPGDRERLSRLIESAQQSAEPAGAPAFDAIRRLPAGADPLTAGPQLAFLKTHEQLNQVRRPGLHHPAHRRVRHRQDRAGSRHP